MCLYLENYLYKLTLGCKKIINSIFEENCSLLLVLSKNFLKIDKFYYITLQTQWILTELFVLSTWEQGGFTDETIFDLVSLFT